MLHQVVILSLNSPYLERITQEQFSSPASLQHVKDSLTICESSVDIVVSILRRFKSQHSLQNSPLIFAHGAIAAADATLMARQYQTDGENSKDQNLSALDNALKGLSSSWEIAAHARNRLQVFLCQFKRSQRQSLK
jgi:hypothetical protein